MDTDAKEEYIRSNEASLHKSFQKMQYSSIIVDMLSTSQPSIYALPGIQDQ